MIKTVGLKKSYLTAAGELEVLRGVDIEIKQSEMTAIMGASGVGKSTLLHILGTLDRPSGGSVYYGSDDVFSLDDSGLAAFRNKTVGFVFQFHHLLPEFTALENVMMPAIISGGIPRKEAVESAKALLNELGVGGRIDHRPGALSGGEQQRVAVARALIMNPKAVLADEPTGNLDTATGDELFGLLKRLNEKHGITFVIVTHNEALSRQCHRILTMVDGAIKDSRG